MDQIRSYIYLGDSQDARHLRNSKENWVVLNVAIDLDPYYSLRDNVKFFKVGLIDGPGNEHYTMISAIVALDKLVKDYPESNLLIHCHAGVSRSPTVLAAYLAITENKSLEQCIEEIVLIRDIVNPNPEVLRTAAIAIKSIHNDQIL